ncbi:MAG: macro domain-containing protein [Anaerolineae bacterium]|nr:macro domain-containing protein [Anaerolineae bacterium]
MTFELILVDPWEPLCRAWREFFADLPSVTIVQDVFQEVPEFHCMVSPANSFGLMDGGVDAAIIGYFGVQLMRDVQAHIIKDYFGEQPVGSSFIISTGHPKHPWLAHTPTMRVPMGITRTDNVYLAMWAMLRAVHQHNERHEQLIGKVLCPGLGTGYGKVPPREAARQMALAYRHYRHPPQRIDWQFAEQRQSDVRYGGDMGFNIPPIG